MANYLTSNTNAGATTPDAAGLQVSTGLDVRLDLVYPRFPPYSTNNYILLSSQFTAANYCWTYYFALSSGRYSAQLSTNGSATNTYAATTDPAIAAGTRHSIRLTWSTAGTLNFWYSLIGIDGPWTKIGTDVSAITSSLYDSAAAIGIIRDGTGTTVSGAHVFAWNLRRSIDGAIVASADFTQRVVGETSFTDAQGNTWTLGNGAYIWSSGGIIRTGMSGGFL